MTSPTVISFQHCFGSASALLHTKEKDCPRIENSLCFCFGILVFLIYNCSCLPRNLYPPEHKLAAKLFNIPFEYIFQLA